MLLNQLPPQALAILRKARQRFYSLPPHRRPSLEQPADLFTGSEAYALAKMGVVPREAIDFLTRTPDERRRTRARFRRRVENQMGVILATKPEAIRSLLFNRRP